MDRSKLIASGFIQPNCEFVRRACLRKWELGSAKQRDAQDRVDELHRCRERRPRQQHVGHDRRRQRYCMRGGVFGRQLHDAMVGKPGDFRTEGEHGERLQPGQQQHARKERASAFHGKSLFGRPAGRKPVRPAAQQSGRPGVAYGDQFPPGPPSPAGASTFGTTSDPMVGQRIGGVSVFGGGFGIYKAGVRVGGLGVSGDTSCTDHMVGWRMRNALNLDQFQGVTGPAALFAGDPTHPDNIIFDITPNPNGGTGNSASGFGHPTCLNNPSPTAVSQLPAVQ